MTKYGKGNYSTKSQTEFSKIKKWGNRAFQDPEMKVYLLEHLMVYPDYEDTKFIGVFSSWQNAERAIKKLVYKPGFCDAPTIIDPSKDEQMSGFIIDEWLVDKLTWQDGFG